MLCDDDGRYIGVDWLASAYRAECHRRRRRTPATDGRTNTALAVQGSELHSGQTDTRR